MSHDGPVQCMDCRGGFSRFSIQTKARQLSTSIRRMLSQRKKRPMFAFHSFPDSMSMELQARPAVRDSMFFFRTKRRKRADPGGGRNGAEKSLQTINGELSRERHYHGHKAPFLYGFVFCRQRHDPSMRRGGEQKSVVVLSQQPYSSVLAPLSQYAGPLYFNQGPEALQLVFEEVALWPPPMADVRMTVHIGDLSLVAQVAPADCLPPPTPQEEEHLPGPFWQDLLADGRGAFFEVDVFTPLRAVLDQAWLLWEAAILALPLLVASPTPAECSSAVAALLALIGPLPYSADFRPYFVIHDPAFSNLTGHEMPSNSNSFPRLLGITNPYFLKALQAWPNVWSTGSKPQQRQALGLPAKAPPKEGRLARGSAAAKKKAGPQSLMAEHYEALWYQDKAHTRPDRLLLERLLLAGPGDPPERQARLAKANSAELRRHFWQLTVALLEPFVPYFQPVLPPEGRDPLPAGKAPHPPSFSHREFLDGLGKASFAPILLDRFTSQSALLNFYRKFLESPNFSSWFERRRNAAWLQQRALWEAARRERGQVSHLIGKSEIELVDALSRAEAALDRAIASHLAAPSDAMLAGEVMSLKLELAHVYEMMPRDLMNALLSSPDRSRHLHSLNIKVPGVPLRVSGDFTQKGQAGAGALDRTSSSTSSIFDSLPPRSVHGTHPPAQPQSRALLLPLRLSSKRQPLSSTTNI
eukprot:jgi/Botrbrau1/16848/Bobra.150_2s0070.1